MRNRTKALVIAVIALPIAYTAAAWLIGMSVQGQLESREQDLLSGAPYIALTHHEYHRGIFEATEQSTYGFRLPAPLAQAAAAAPGGTSALQLTVRNRIYHGPLPRLRSIALASIDTELVPPPQVGRALNALFGSQPVVTIRTSLGWLGGTRTEVSSPAFRMQLPAGGLLSSQGLRASIETTRGRAAWTVHLLSGGLAFQGARGRADLGPIAVDAAMRRAFQGLYVGDSQLKLDRAQLQGASGGPLGLKGLSVRGTSSADGQYLDTAADLAAEEFRTEKLAFSHLVYSLRVGHLEGSSLAALTQALRAAQSGSGVALGAPPPAAIRDAWNRYGVDLLTHDPVLEIPQLGFAMPEGEFHLSATLAAHGIKREDLTGPAGFMAVVPHLDAAVDASIDVALLEKLMGLSPQAAQHSQQIERLAQQGFLKREGSKWRARIAYRAGKLTVNGQSFPPTPSS